MTDTSMQPGLRLLSMKGLQNAYTNIPNPLLKPHHYVQDVYDNDPWKDLRNSREVQVTRPKVLKQMLESKNKNKESTNYTKIAIYAGVGLLIAYGLYKYTNASST